jgi:uncharacterized membrane protein YecN with MAPEG domain
MALRLGKQSAREAAGMGDQRGGLGPLLSYAGAGAFTGEPQEVKMQITGIYAALSALLLLALSYRIVRLRWKYQVGIGSGGADELERAIRVHGNFIEYVPLALLLLALVESQGAAPWFLHATGLVLIVARLLHAQGLSQSPGRTPGRFIGTSLTWLLLLLLAGANLGSAWWALAPR